jgi:sigma-B regulation protein RsbU (phosphoserine phosphatase)
LVELDVLPKKMGIAVPRVDSPKPKLAQLEPPPRAPAFEELPGLGELCRTFTQATGWPLRFVSKLKQGVELLWSAPVCPGVDAPPGYLRIDLGNASSLDDLRRRVPLEAAQRLAESIGHQLQSQWELRTALWQREAELATAVPVLGRTDESQQLARRLQTIVRSAADALRCPAAALYLLDDATTELKLRSAWGLPAQQLTLPARPLAGALADLEALLGHAVVLESPVLLQRWQVPEPCQSAICVPVSSAENPLGTFWVFNNEARDYSAAETNLVEIIAGRLAAELERSSLLSEQRQQTQQARRLDLDREISLIPSGPSHKPLCPQFDIAGWSQNAGNLGGAFHDWNLLADGRLAVILGDACDGGLAGALTATTLRGLLRNEFDRATKSTNWSAVLQGCHRTLCSLSAGNHWAGVLLVILDPRTGEAELHSAGRPLALHLSWQELLRRENNKRDDSNAKPRGSAPWSKTSDKTFVEADLPWPDQQKTPPRPEQKQNTDRLPHPAEPEKRFDPTAPKKIANDIKRVITPAAKRLELPCENLVRPTSPLGIGLEAELGTAKKLLVPGDLLIGLNRGLADSRDVQGNAFDLARVLGITSTSLLMKPDEILELLRGNLAEQGFTPEERDLAAMLIQCRGKCS